MTQFSVLLLTPDYLADQYGEDTFYCHVAASDIEAATREAQTFAAAAYSDNVIPDDFLPLFVTTGWHENLVGRQR